MAEYNSAYTGKEIDERLGKVPGLEESVNQLSSQKVNADDVFNIGEKTMPDYTNQIPLSEDENGERLNAYGYIGGKTLNSDGTLGDSSIANVSGFIKVKKGDMIRVYDPGVTNWSGVQYALYSADKSTKAGIGKFLNQGNIEQTQYGLITISENVVTWDTSSITYYYWNDFAWLRVTTFSPNAVVTVNEPLTESAHKQYTLKPEVVVTPESLGGVSLGKSLSGKTVVCFGDSIFGRFRDATSVPAHIALYTGATVYNVGFDACRMSVHPDTGYAAFSMWALSKAIAENNWAQQDAEVSSGAGYFLGQLALLKSIDFNSVDMVVIHYGTNDYAVGGSTVIDNENDPDDCTTLCGALRYSIEKLLSAYPKLQFYISTPVYRVFGGISNGTYAEDYVYYGHKLSDFGDALRGVAAEYNFPVIDGYNGMGVNRYNAAAYLSDGTHHNEDGRKLFGEFIGGHLIGKQSIAKSGVDVETVSDLISAAIGDAIKEGY